MDITFALRGMEGHVSVTYSRNDRPDVVGSSAESSGFPMCHASVDYPAQGYDALLGWMEVPMSARTMARRAVYESETAESGNTAPLTRYTPEDRCHLNGLTLRDGVPRYLTSISRSDVPAGWRKRRGDGGCLHDVESAEPITTDPT